MGGPTSGFEKGIIKENHGKLSNFKRSSPSPDRLFDDTRGACPEINSYNHINQFMPSKGEKPRLTVLQNFKEINRIMTSTFMKNKALEEKYGRIPNDILAKKESEDVASQNMTQIMKKMVSPRTFNGELRKFGSV